MGDGWMHNLEAAGGVDGADRDVFIVDAVAEGVRDASVPKPPQQ